VALNEASLALGKAWGLATTCCSLTGEREGQFGVEGILRSVHHLVGQAATLVKGTPPALEVQAAQAVCDLLLVDAQEGTYGSESPSMWALESLPDAVKHAKGVVDAA